jgi:hypothetical protein
VEDVGWQAVVDNHTGTRRIGKLEPLDHL